MSILKGANTNKNDLSSFKTSFGSKYPSDTNASYIRAQEFNASSELGIQLRSYDILYKYGDSVFSNAGVTKRWALTALRYSQTMYHGKDPVEALNVFARDKINHGKFFTVLFKDEGPLT
jgi:hypothetical protein